MRERGRALRARRVHHGWRRAALLCMLAVVAVAARPLSASAARDWNRIDDPLKSAVGIHAGKIGGVGLSLKFPLWWWLYVQPTGVVWHREDRTRYDFGLQLMYLLRQDAKLRVYTVAGAAYYYDKQSYDEGGQTHDEVDDYVNWGAGIGVEWLLSSRWSLQGDVDFTYNGGNGDIYPFPQVGLYFYW